MADPAAEGNRLLNSKRTCELFEALPFGAVTNHGEARQIIPQKGSSPAQSKIAGLPRNQTSHKNQLESGSRLRAARVTGNEGRSDAGFRDEKHLVSKGGKLRVRLGRSCDNRRRVVISRPGKRQKPVEAPHARYPLAFILRAKAGWPGQTAMHRPNHEGYRSLTQEVSEGTWENRRHWHQP